MGISGQDCKVFAGDDVLLTFDVTDEAGAAVDIGDFDLNWQLSRYLGGPSLMTKTLGSGLTIVKAAAGRLAVAIQSAESAGLKGAYRHELRRVDSPNSQVLATGTIRFLSVIG